MKLPRDLDGRELAKRLARLGYTQDWQSGSHIICTTQAGPQHRVSIPDHRPLKAGTLSAILSRIESHSGLTRDELLRRLGF
jgi:predicted RNA binding protein YcfA (HicA-like mRNA interferase family)